MIEKQTYRVIMRDGKYEVRFYEGFNVARIVKKRNGDYNQGLNDVFDYISGANVNKKKISRTSPVLTSETKDTITTALIMPRKYKLGELPKPTNPHIKIERIKGGYFAAVRFNGIWTKQKSKRFQRNLKNWIDTRIWDPLSDEMIARYFAPLTPSLMRRNEILIRMIMKEEI